VILVDTHTTIWLAEAPEELSKRAHEAIRLERQIDGLAISDKTLWELAMAISRGRLIVRTSVRDFLQIVEQSFTVLPITSAIAERSVLFSDQYPKDPTDRIIGATALVHGMKLITRDKRIRASREVDCIW
jgi:PIN domain nuclease of toxin-antitoxin system